MTTDAAGALHDEAGFVDVPPQAHGSPFAGRLFYAFEAADVDPTGAPLVVFFAGGPGYPSSLDLLPYGLARATLTPSLPGQPPTPNPARWTSFANVLFVDERQSGFSYELQPSARAGAGACAYSPVDDAADAVRAVLGFLDSHPALQRAPVILVGQSYGGERVTLALDLLLRYPAEAARADGALAAQIQAHYDAVLTGHAPGSPVDEAIAATQFGRAVLLQPFVLGGPQFATQLQIGPSDPYVGPYIGTAPGDRDAYDVRQPQGWSTGLDESAAIALADPASATALLGVQPASIPRLGPSARAAAFRDPVTVASTATPLLDGALAAQLGALAASDGYFVYPATACPFDESLYQGAGASAEFLANLSAGVRTFVTNSRYDSVVYAPAIPATLSQSVSVVVDSAPRAGVARPGWFTVAPRDGAGGAVEVRFPAYVDSGHFVAVAQPQELHDDVAEWIASP